MYPVVGAQKQMPHRYPAKFADAPGINNQRYNSASVLQRHGGVTDFATKGRVMFGDRDA